MQDVFSYAIYPDCRVIKKSKATCIQNVVDKDKKYKHEYNGKYFPPGSFSSEINGLIREAMDTLMPNDLIGKLRRCATPQDLEDTLRQNEVHFDTFHYPKNGVGRPPLVNIMDTKMPQPRRVGYSCYAEPAYHFPSLGINCQKLFTYGANGRVDADIRSRPMPPSLYKLGVECWKQVRHELSPMCQKCPPYSCQVLLYPSLFGGEMRLHHDNAIWKNGKLHGGNPNKEMNSHIYGSDVMMITIGDSMEYHLVYPNYSEGQDYTMSQAEAIDNKKAGLSKVIELEDSSIYIHPAHDDEMYYHGLNFSKGLKKESRVRVALVWRWLAVPVYFRQNANDDRCNRYSMINKSSPLGRQKKFFTPCPPDHSGGRTQ
jgi:hypothetical protein